MRSPERVLLARRRAALPRLARRPRRRPHQRPVRRQLQRVPRQPLGHVRLPRARGRAGHPAAAAGGRLDVAARPRPRPHDRADGLHDQRRERRAGRGLRAQAVHQAAVAPAVLPGAVRGGRARARRSTCSCTSSRSPTARRSCRSSSSSPSRSSRATGSRSGACRGARCAATWTASPRSTTPPGARTGASRPTPSATSTSTPRRCSSSSTATGSWSPRPPEGETAAVAITVPDVNQVLEKMNGRLLPLGWWHFLRKAQDDRPGSSRLPRRQAGVPAHRASRPRSTSSTSTPPRGSPQKWGEMGWILETNRNMNRAMEAMGGRVVRRFRVYERDL